MSAARGAKAVTLALSTTATVGLAGLFAEQDEVPLTVANNATIATTGIGSTTTSEPSASVLADGVFVGDAETNQWGTVQVQIVVSGGVITDVQVLSAPDSDRRSVNINERALDDLAHEVIATQNADLDAVSGATQTWQSYTVSLQSAIDAAKAAA